MSAPTKVYEKMKDKTLSSPKWYANLSHLQPATLESNKADPMVTKPYYHGLLPREEVEAILVNYGDFLLRRTKVNESDRYIISVRGAITYHHVIVYPDKNEWRISDDKSFKTIHLLVQHYSGKKEALNAEGLQLLNPVVRQKWHLQHDQIIVGRKLGSGAFGEVSLGSLRVGKHTQIPVAVKLLKTTGEVSKADRQTFVSEASTMRRYTHPNVVQLIGIAASKEPIMLVLEFCQGGCLLDLLGKLKAQQASGDVIAVRREQLRCCKEASDGLAYLESKDCVHRDIAARNCLIGDNATLKISDFGMSLVVSKVKKYKEFKNLQVPVRWLAVETMINHEFSTKSDVWSFCVLICEIYAFGQRPYPGMSNVEVRHAVQLDNFRMTAPQDTPVPLARIAYLGWHRDPQRRPSFDEMSKWIGRYNEYVRTKSL